MSTALGCACVLAEVAFVALVALALARRPRPRRELLDTEDGHPTLPVEVETPAASTGRKLFRAPGSCVLCGAETPWRTEAQREDGGGGFGVWFPLCLGHDLDLRATSLDPEVEPTVGPDGPKMSFRLRLRAVERRKP